MATRFNGFGDIETVACEDAPAASMFGLASRSIPVPRSETQNVVRLNKARGRKRRRK
jgi:ornithine decarboxylase